MSRSIPQRRSLCSWNLLLSATVFAVIFSCLSWGSSFAKGNDNKHDRDIKQTCSLPDNTKDYAYDCVQGYVRATYRANPVYQWEYIKSSSGTDYWQLVSPAQINTPSVGSTQTVQPKEATETVQNSKVPTAPVAIGATAPTQEKGESVAPVSNPAEDKKEDKKEDKSFIGKITDGAVEVGKTLVDVAVDATSRTIKGK